MPPMNRPIPNPSAVDFAPFHHASTQSTSLPCAFCPNGVEKSDSMPMMPPCQPAAAAVLIMYRLTLPTIAFFKRSR